MIISFFRVAYDAVARSENHFPSIPPKTISKRIKSDTVWCYFQAISIYNIASKVVQIKRVALVVARREAFAMMLLANEEHSSAFIRGSVRCASVCVRARVTGSVPRRDVKPLIRRMFSLSPFRDSLCSLPHYSRLFCLSPLSFPLWPRLSALLIARNRCKPACMYRDIHIYMYIHTHLSVCRYCDLWWSIQRAAHLLRSGTTTSLASTHQNSFSVFFTSFLLLREGGVSSYWHSTNN